MKLSAMECFYRVVEAGSMRGAAESLYISPSAVSRKIALLEDDIGYQLLERQRRGVKPTQDGAIVYERFRDILSSIKKIGEELDDLHGLFRGKVRVATLEGAVANLLPKAVADMHALYPRITFDIFTTDASQAVAAVLDDDADILIAFNIKKNSQLSVLLHLDLPLYVVMCPEHPLSGKAEISVKDLDGMEVGYLTENHGSRLLVEAMLAEYDIKLNPILITNSVETLKSFTRHNLGITFLPKFVVDREVRNRELVIVPCVESSLLTGRMVVASRLNRPVPRAAKELVKHINNLFYL